jgi:Cytochrome c7 and related cytochrome c
MLARFNHSAHVKIVPGECTGCHKGLEQSDKVTKAALPKMEQCLVCHTKIDPPDSCVLCHVVGPGLKPASHTPEWGDLHSNSKIEKTGCWVCHGKRFTCQGCH